MAVMTSSALDQISLDIKAKSFTQPEAMALDAESNGVHDVLLDEPNGRVSADVAPSSTIESLPEPTTNGNHASSDSLPPAIEPTTNVSSGIEPIAPFKAELDSDLNAAALIDNPEAGATSLPSAVEAPTSDVRDEAGPELSAQSIDTGAATQSTDTSTQQVPETQLEATDSMDTSNDASALSIDTAPTKPMTELTLQTQQSATSPSQPQLTQSPTNVDQEMDDAPASGKVRSREDDDEGDAPDAKRTKTESEGEIKTEFKVPEVPVHSEQPNGHAGAPSNSADPTSVQSAVNYEEWPTTPMTPLQNKFLLERVRNTKKIKVSGAFKEPVNPEALNIPHYREIIKNPMDLSTMENKLKENKYPIIREFMEDLDLIIDNSITFNGKEHPVTQAGYNMRAYFLKGTGKMPRAGVEEPVKQPKAKKPSVTMSTKPRREPRAPASTAKSPTGPAPTAASPQTPWPLNADGLPLIRRDSSSANDRPKREIHRPPPKDLPYNNAKPRKKKYQQELKFCESIISEITKQKYAKFSYPFMSPVDPVALNIPSYLKIIKKPMDFGTIEKNLKGDQYQSAKDFYNDAQLVFQNCYKFNPEGDEVNKMGKELNALFDKLWSEKADWLAQHGGASDPQSPGTTYSDEEEEEEEEEIDPAQQQILDIQQQIALLNETAQSLLQQQKIKRTSPKVPGKKKAGKPAAPKKKGSLAVPPPLKPQKAKARTKAPAPLSFGQKQEISEGISTLGDTEMRRAVQIIRNGCPHLAGVNDEEMEIDMDEIGDDTLRELLKFLRQVRGPKTVADDDFEPARPTPKTSTTKPKKNKPMGKKEQEDNIRKIQDQLRNFTEAGVSGSSQSPPAHQDDSSDDESSGSESEEE